MFLKFDITKKIDVPLFSLFLWLSIKNVEEIKLQLISTRICHENLFF